MQFPELKKYLIRLYKEYVKKHLKKNAIPYEEKITPDNKISQLFIKDPNGIKIELSKSL